MFDPLEKHLFGMFLFNFAILYFFIKNQKKHIPQTSLHKTRQKNSRTKNTHTHTHKTRRDRRWTSRLQKKVWFSCPRHSQWPWGCYLPLSPRSYWWYLPAASRVVVGSVWGISKSPTSRENTMQFVLFVFVRVGCFFQRKYTKTYKRKNIRGTSLLYMVPACICLAKRGVPASVFEFCRTFTWPIVVSLLWMCGLYMSEWIVSGMIMICYTVVPSCICWIYPPTQDAIVSKLLLQLGRP